MAIAMKTQASAREVPDLAGPKAEAGNATLKLNALRHGRRAKAVASVLPLVDPAALEERIRRWVEDMKPGDAAERELVERAAKTSLELDGLERVEADGRARGVQDALSRRDDETARNVRDMGRKLLAPADSGPARDDDPEILLRGLEGSAEGCRWLRDRWAELKQVIGNAKALTHMDLYRWVRLQGKQPIDAIYDPDLNRQFLAWEALAPSFAADFWERCREMASPCDPGFGGSMRWRAIVAKPASNEEVVAVLSGVIKGRIARLKEMIGLYEEVAGEEAVALADAAWFDPSAEAEALRKRRSALTRELRQLIELILRMQAARERRVARDEPRRRGGRGEEKARPDGSREGFTTEGGRLAKPGRDVRGGGPEAERAAGTGPPRRDASGSRARTRGPASPHSLETLLAGVINSIMLADTAKPGPNAEAPTTLRAEVAKRPFFPPNRPRVRRANGPKRTRRASPPSGPRSSCPARPRMAGKVEGPSRPDPRGPAPPRHCVASPRLVV